MKRNSFGRRVVSFTLAASVALPQSASVFAVSLYDDRGAAALQQAVSGERPAASTMPWVTLPSKGGSADSAYTTGKDTELTTPSDTGGTTDVSKDETTEGTSPPAPSATPTTPPNSTYTADKDTELTKPPDTGGTTDVPKGETTEGASPPSTSDPPSTPPNSTYTTDKDTELTLNNSGVASISLGENSLTLTNWSFYKLGYGVALTDWSRGESKHKLADYKGLFAVERDESNASPAENGYGSVYHDDGSNTLVYYENDDRDEDGNLNYYSFCVFPNEATLGRVPDLEFDGWYVYNSEAASNLAKSNAQNWKYEEGTTSRVETSDYTESDYGYNTDSSDSSLFGYAKYGDTWDGGKDYGYGYLVYDDANPVLQNDTPVSFVAKWKASSKSQAREIKVYKSSDTGKTDALTLYSRDLEKQTTLSDTDKATTANSTTGLESTTYYLRVDADVDSLTLDLSTWELYFSDYKDLNKDANEQEEDKEGGGFPDYKYVLDNSKDYHVSVSYTLSDGTTDTVGKNGISAVMLPKWTEADETSGIGVEPINATDDPAHSKWTIANIPLTAANETTTYNTITVTVTAPDNVTTTTYTIKVERLTQPTVTKNAGNTPFGMIARDENSTTLTSDELKQQARDYFLDRAEDGVVNRAFSSTLYPTGSNNNGGSIYRGRYSEYAWSDEKDVDTDETAIVAYLNSTFRDSGLSLTDTEGKRVDTLNGTSYKLYRSIKLKQAGSLDPTKIGDDTYGTDCWYQGGGLVTSDNVTNDGYELVTTANGADVIDLRGMNIVPGVYTISYRYYDPVTNTTYPREGDDTSAYTRTLVILPTVGDVDMDGAITVADAMYLEQMLGKNTTLGYTTLNGKTVWDAVSKDSSSVNDIVSLYAYRVCDVNGDGVLNDDDVAYLKTMPTTRLKWVGEDKKGNSDYFYLPTTTTDSTTRETLTTTDSDARVELVYLGKEQGTHQSDGWFSSPSGPWAESLSDADKIEMEDVFWIGVRLQGVDSLGLEKIKALTFSVVYDSYYLTPASVLDETTWTKVQGENDGTASDETLWFSTLSKYNIPATESTIWNGQYTLNAGTRSSKDFTATASTARVPLENSVSKENDLKTLTFSVELRKDAEGVLLQNGSEQYLLAIPFRLTRHPFGKTEAELINVNADMSGFTLVTTKTVDGKEQLTTYAYTEKDTTLQGGRTENLKSVLKYQNAGVTIPLGEDKSVVYQIYQSYDSASGTGTNAVYGTWLNRITGGYLTARDQEKHPNEKATQEIPLNADVDSDSLPPGLTYNAGGWIEGMPTAAGDYTFDIGNVHFHMVVEKQELHYWANNEASYYGEEEYRGEHGAGFTFKYDPDDIRDPSREDGKPTTTPDGKGEHLQELLTELNGLGGETYEAPQFRAVTEDGAVTNATKVGSYKIVTCEEHEPVLANYKLVYIGAEKGSKLDILKRPIKVSYINGTTTNPTVVATIFTDETGAVTGREAWQGTDVDTTKHVTFTVEGANSRNDLTLNSYHDYQDGMLLPGDSLQIRYSIQYLRNDADKEWDANSAYFYLTDEELTGTRDVRVTKLELIGGDNFENYTLESNLPTETVRAGAVVGELKKRMIRALEIVETPPLEYTYGDKLDRGGELKFYIEKDGDAEKKDDAGADDETVKDGIYSYYSGEYAKKYNISFYWASAEEYEAYQASENKDVFDASPYEADSFIYEPNARLTTDYNGKYLCMSSATVDENNNPKTVRVYWDTPLTVKPKELVLTVKTAKQYYGEDHQQGLSFTYDPKQLESMDYAKGTNLTGDGAELTTLLVEYGYVAPELKAVVTLKDTKDDTVKTENLLTQKTRYTGADNYVVIYNASISKNYKLVYQYTNTKGEISQREDFGSAVYRIEQRPIVVDGLAMTVNTAEQPLVQVYADTRVIAVPDCALTLEQVQVGLPQGTYFTEKSNISKELLQEFDSEATAVVNGDKIGFSYTATVIPTGSEAVRQEYLNYTGFSHGHYDMTDVDEELGYKEYPVQISDLVLTGEGDAEKNYVLVYRSSQTAALKTVDSVQTEIGIMPKSNASYPYKAATDNSESTQGTAQARVLLRPIESIEIVSAGRVTYTYGEGYSPEQRDLESSLTAKGLTVKIKYETNNPAVRDFEENDTEESVEFYVSSTVGETVTTSFDTRSLKIYYVKNGNVITDEAHELKRGSALTVKEHSGAQLVVTGKRGAQAEVKQSAVSTERLSVTAKSLVLTADDALRFYGEENPEFTYTVPARELAAWDRETLGVNEYGTVTGAQLASLASECDYTYRQPTLTTTATASSNVLNGGADGYEITGHGGELENYSFSFEAGTLYVYPRPVKIVSFIQTEPVYTIYSDLTAKNYTTNLSTHRRNADSSTTAQFTLGVENSGTVKNKDDENVTLPIKNTTALVGNDEITIKVQVSFKAEDLTKKDTHDCDVTVSNATMVAGTTAADNYVFIQNNGSAVIDNPNAKGRVELRNISYIEVTRAPKVNYSYGDILDLTDLVVTIHYKDDEKKTELVYYMGKDYFAQYGLRVFYYESATVDIDTEALVKKRSAQTGDHVTIAPTHDSRLDGTNFAANGMYLVVTAETRDGTDVKYNDAKIVTKDGNAAQLTVAPQPIYYTLKATDKIYDGNVQTAGTITFTEVFQKSGEVDENNQNGVTDLVYPVLNADYETNWTSGKWKERFEDFSGYVEKNGYSFTTGKYVANDPDEPTVNQTIDWTAGYTWGEGLSFAYLDPNVAYEGEDFTSEPIEKTVQVLGLQLAGPDAANYTLVGQVAGSVIDVTTNTAIGLLDETLPTATIHKANRANLTDALLPSVELDAHTNVVRINYDQTTDIIKRASDAEGLSGEEEQYQEQVHFEYALQKLVTDETTTVVGVEQWAGKDGTLEWDTGMYFGGEARRPDPITTEDTENHDPYVPKEDDIPTAEDITEDTVTKGQLYRWAEEDEGFYLDASLYPNGEIWLAYELYSTDRTALERDAVYVPLVRAAETHNYNASLPISSMSNYLYETVSELLTAQRAKNVATAEEQESAQAALDAALRAASEALNGAVTTAYTDAQAEVDSLTAEESQELEARPVEHRDATTAVKTYKQLIETMSVKELYGEETESKEPYQVPTLEAVWFTDVQTVADKETLDVVLWNKEPARYRTYAWDSNLSAELTFEEDTPLDLSEPLEVTVTDRRVNGSEESEHTVTVNVDNTATLYVDTNFSSGTTWLKAKQIVLRPGSIMAAVNDEPVELGVTIYPLRARVLRIIWTSSDTSVATVSDEGVIRFVGAGSAVITASIPEYYDGNSILCSASVQVTVVESWKEAYPNSIFNFGYTESFLTTNVTENEDGEEQLFQPDESITRGEIAQVLAQFYVENSAWERTGPTEFSDLTGEESYAEAVLLLSGKGVFLGYPDGTFQGEQAVSRAELVTLLARMTGVTVVDTAGQPHAFLDTNEEDTWAYAEIDAMSKLDGVLLGVGDGYFEPNRIITRSEVAALLTRLLRFPWVQKDELVVPDDVDEEHWGRDSILRAVNGSFVLEETPHEALE